MHEFLHSRDSVELGEALTDLNSTAVHLALLNQRGTISGELACYRIGGGSVRGSRYIHVNLERAQINYRVARKCDGDDRIRASGGGARSLEAVAIRIPAFELRHGKGNVFRYKLHFYRLSTEKKVNSEQPWPDRALTQARQEELVVRRKGPIEAPCDRPSAPRRLA